MRYNIEINKKNIFNKIKFIDIEQNDLKNN